MAKKIEKAEVVVEANDAKAEAKAAEQREKERCEFEEANDGVVRYSDLKRLGLI
jgi:hypothetical protein